MKFEITYKNGKKDKLPKEKLPKFSPHFNKMVKELKINESMYEITEMIEIKRIE
jgi:hypothetical protein